MNRTRWIAAVVVVLAFGAIAVFEPGRYLNLEYLNAQQDLLRSQVAQAPLSAAALFFALYALVAALALPR